MKTKADENRLSDLYFQLPSPDRRMIIEELQTNTLKLSEVAKKLDMPRQSGYPIAAPTRRCAGLVPVGKGLRG